MARRNVEQLYKWICIFIFWKTLMRFYLQMCERMGVVRTPHEIWFLFLCWRNLNDPWAFNILQRCIAAMMWNVIADIWSGSFNCAFHALFAMKIVHITMHMQYKIISFFLLCLERSWTFIHNILYWSFYRFFFFLSWQETLIITQ